MVTALSASTVSYRMGKGMDLYVLDDSGVYDKDYSLLTGISEVIWPTS